MTNGDKGRVVGNITRLGKNNWNVLSCVGILALRNTRVNKVCIMGLVLNGLLLWLETLQYPQRIQTNMVDM